MLIYLTSTDTEKRERTHTDIFSPEVLKNVFARNVKHHGKCSSSSSQTRSYDCKINYISQNVNQTL